MHCQNINSTLLLEMMIFGMLEASCAVDSMWRQHIKCMQYNSFSKFKTILKFSLETMPLPHTIVLEVYFAPARPHTSWRFPLFWQQRLPESTWKTDVVAVCTQTLWQAVTWGGTIQHRFRSRPTIHHRHHCRLAECFFHVGVALRIRIIHHRWGHDPCSDDQGWHFGRKEGRQSEQEVCGTSPFLRKHLKIFMSVFTITYFKHDNDIHATFRSSWTPHQEL